MAQDGLNLDALADEMRRMSQALQQSQEQNALLQTQMSSLAQQQQQQRAAGTGTQPNVTMQDLGQIFASITQSQRDLADAMRSQHERKFALIDTKGLAKPDGAEENFLYWRVRLESFIVASMPDLEEVLEWSEEHEDEITKAAIKAAWGSMNPTHKEVRDIEQVDAQLYALLQTLCECEAFTIVRSAGKNNGLESWRRLVKRFDPSTGGRRRAMLHILNPAKVNSVEELSAAVESWEEMVRQYGSRRKADGSRHQLDEEIKIAILEHICPAEIERHLQLNRQRYAGETDVRNELVMYLETRLGTRIKNFSLSAGADDNVALMDIGGKGKKGKDGKGKSNAANPTCHNCGKPGHYIKGLGFRV